jgi:hypothetical protein
MAGVSFWRRLEKSFSPVGTPKNLRAGKHQKNVGGGQPVAPYIITFKL